MKKSCTLWLALFLLLVFRCSLFAQDPGKTLLSEQMTRDNSVVAQSRQGLVQIVAFINAHPDLFPRSRQKMVYPSASKIGI